MFFLIKKFKKMKLKFYECLKKKKKYYKVSKKTP